MPNWLGNCEAPAPKKEAERIAPQQSEIMGGWPKKKSKQCVVYICSVCIYRLIYGHAYT